MEKTDKKTKKRMKIIILEEMLGKIISLKSLKGKKTKEEKEAIKLLTKWHKNANKRSFFVGDKKSNQW